MTDVSRAIERAVEKAARSIEAHHNKISDYVMLDEDAEAMARAAIRAFLGALEPTKAMLDAGDEYRGSEQKCRAMFSTLLSEIEKMETK